MKQVSRISFTQINLVLTVCVLNACTGAGLLLIGWPQTKVEQHFIGTSSFIIWLVWDIIFFALMPVAFIYGISTIKYLNNFFRSYLSINTIWSINTVWFLLIFGFLFAVPQLIINNFPEIFSLQRVATLSIRVNIHIALFGLSLLPSFIGLSGMTAAAVTLNPTQEDFVFQYFTLRKSLNGIMTLVGSLVGLGTLATGGLQRALAASIISQPFPQELAILYGTYGSLVLFALSLPIELMLLGQSNQFIESNIPNTSLNMNNWSENYDLRQKARDWLDISKNPLSLLRTNLINLAPLFGGLLSYFLPIS